MILSEQEMDTKASFVILLDCMIEDCVSENLITAQHIRVNPVSVLQVMQVHSLTFMQAAYSAAAAHLADVGAGCACVICAQEAPRRAELAALSAVSCLSAALAAEPIAWKAVLAVRSAAAVVRPDGASRAAACRQEQLLATPWLMQPAP